MWEFVLHTEVLENTTGVCSGFGQFHRSLASWGQGLPAANTAALPSFSGTQMLWFVCMHG